MKIIVTAAGLGSRFKNIGIDKPKYKIIARGKSLYEWSMLSLKDFFEEEFIFVFRKEILDEEFVCEINKKLGINNYSIIELDDITNGQATTAFLADDKILENDEVIIYNIDTYVEPYEIKKSDIKDSMWGFIPVIQAEGDRWSFIKINSEMKVVDIAEKKPISNLATIGLYYFRQWKDYKDIYLNNQEEIMKNNKELYIAPMYKYMINNKFTSTKVLDSKKVFILGTPEEIEAFDKNYLKENTI